MTVGDEDALKTMARYAFRDIQHKMEQVLGADINRTGKIHVVAFKPVGDQRQQQNVSVGALGRLLADTPDEEVIGIERQVAFVVFNRTDRKDGYGPGPCEV